MTQDAESVRMFPEQAGDRACYCEAAVGCHIHPERAADPLRLLDDLLERIEADPYDPRGGIAEELREVRAATGVAMGLPEVPTAYDWVAAIATIRDHYPADIFPPDSDSPDARAGTWARKVCDNIVAEAHRRLADRIDGGEA